MDGLQPNNNDLANAILNANNPNQPNNPNNRNNNQQNININNNINNVPPLLSTQQINQSNSNQPKNTNMDLNQSNNNQSIDNNNNNNIDINNINGININNDTNNNNNNNNQPSQHSNNNNNESKINDSIISNQMEIDKNKPKHRKPKPSSRTIQALKLIDPIQNAAGRGASKVHSTVKTSSQRLLHKLRKG